MDQLIKAAIEAVTRTRALSGDSADFSEVRRGVAGLPLEELHRALTALGELAYIVDRELDDHATALALLAALRPSLQRLRAANGVGALA